MQNKLFAFKGSGREIKFALYLVTAVFITFGLSVSFGNLSAVWTPPTAPPPYGDFIQPIYATSSFYMQYIRHETTGSQTGLYIGGDLVVVDQGYFDSLGVGTTSGTYRLKINGDVNITGNIDMPGTTLSHDIENTFHLNSNDGLQLRINANGGTALFGIHNSLNTQVLTVTNSGNVGIGSTTPGRKLDVGGDILASGDICIPGKCLSVMTGGESGTVNAGLAGQAAYYAANGTAVSGTSTVFINAAGYVGIGTNQPYAPLQVQLPAESITVNWASGPDSALRNGDVNVISDNSLISMIGHNSSAYAGGAKLIALNPANGDYVDQWVIWRGTSDVGRKNNFNITYQSSESNFHSAIIPVISLTPTGNVGIGTTAPASKLDVAGNVKASDFCLQDNSKCLSTLAAGGSGTVNAGLAGQAAYYAANGTAVSGTSSLFITATGKVGIGTMGPIAKLGIDMRALTATEGFHISRDAAASHYAYLNIVDENDNAIFKVHENGKIGIGTSQPVSALHINNSDNIAVNWSSGPDSGLRNADINLTGSDAIINVIGKNESAFAGVLKFVNVEPATGNYLDQWVIWRGTTEPGRTNNFNISYQGQGPGETRFHGTDKIPAISVTPSRFVGIGTGTPAAMLDVAGTTWLTGAATIGGSSYVNAGAYALYVNGNVRVNGTLTYGTPSDTRLKTNIRPMTGALDKLLRLEGVNFEWINPEEHGDAADVQGGFLAQDVEELFPDWVSEISAGGKDAALLPPDGQAKALDFTAEYDALLVESIKELKEQLDTAAATIEKQQSQIDELMLMVERLEKY